MSESDPQITADVSSDAVDERTLKILYDLHEETVLSFRGLIANRRGSQGYDSALMTFTSALTTEILFLEPALRQSEYYEDVELGTLEHAEGTLVFNGLASIVECAEGVTITKVVETAGMGNNTKKVDETVLIPPDILKAAFRLLQQWYDDVGLSTEFSKETDEWEI